MTSFNEQFLHAKKDVGEKKYQTNSFCCWGCKTSRNKTHQHFLSVRKKKIIPIIATVSQNNPWKKLLPYRFGNWGTRSSSNACVGGARILTRCLCPTLDEDRQGFPSTSPCDLPSPLHLHGKPHLGIQSLLAVRKQPEWGPNRASNLSIARIGPHARRDGNAMIEGRLSLPLLAATGSQQNPAKTVNLARNFQDEYKNIIRPPPWSWHKCLQGGKTQCLHFEAEFLLCMSFAARIPLVGRR